MDSYDDTELALMKFGVGQPVPRMEDPTLLRGQGRYTDDQNLPRQAYAVMVRSRLAHGILKGIDSIAAAMSAWVRIASTPGMPRAALLSMPFRTP